MELKVYTQLRISLTQHQKIWWFYFWHKSVKHLCFGYLFVCYLKTEYLVGGHRIDYQRFKAVIGHTKKDDC